MGLLDRFRRKKQPKVMEQAKYVLKRRNETGGMVKVMDLPRMMTPEELYPSLAAGIYVVHKYEKGATGFTETGPVFEVQGEASSREPAMARRQSPFAGLREMAEDMKTMKDDLGTFFEVFGSMAGYTKAGEGQQKGLIEQLKEAKDTKDTLDKIFPSSTTESQNIPITGSIPAWMVYAPKVVDESMNNIEKRLHKWGIIEEVGPGDGEEKEIIKLPEKPKAAKREELKPVEVEETKEEAVIEMPPKPTKTEEIREVKVEEKKEKKDVRKTEKSGKKR